MWDFIIKRELNKTIIDMNKKKIQSDSAANKLDNLVRLTRENVSKGKKRELKNDIFRVKKMFKM